MLSTMARNQASDRERGDRRDPIGDRTGDAALVAGVARGSRILGLRDSDAPATETSSGMRSDSVRTDAGGEKKIASIPYFPMPYRLICERASVVCP
jgi:hypothetical protein